MSESVMPAVLLRALNEYGCWSSSLEEIADGKDHVRVELTFHKTLPTLPVYKRRAESRRQPAPSVGEWPRQPTAARQPPPPTTRPTPPARRRRRRRQHCQHRRHYRSSQQLSSQCKDHRRQHRSRHHLSSRDQLHRLLLQNHHRQRSREQSRRRRTLHPCSTSMSTLRKSTLYMRSTTSRMSPLQSSRPSPKLKVYQKTTKNSTLIYNKS